MFNSTLSNTSAYLWWLIHYEKLKGEDIFVRTIAMQDWLNENIGRIDTTDQSWYNNYKWSDNTTKVDGMIFANALWFKDKIDLMAFKLRWGINS